MRKLYLPIAALMIAILLGTAACAPSELKPVTVELGYISNEWYGEETIVADIFFTIKNPNDVPVNLDSFTYSIKANDIPVTMKTVVPGTIIPAKGQLSLSYANVIPFTGFGGVAFEQYYMAKGMEYVPAHVAGIPIWKAIGGKKPPLWNYPALGTLAGLRGGPTVDDVKAGTADTAAIVGLYAKLRGTIDAVQGGVDKAWDAAPAGPCVYTVTGKAIVSYGNLSKDTSFNLKYEKK